MALRTGLRTAALAVALGCAPKSAGPSPGDAAVAPESAPSASTSSVLAVSAASTESTASRPALSSAPEASLAAPAVVVENIGMHIGGGPNDAVTKEPIARSVAPSFPRFRACWAEASEPRTGGTFGVDLLIDAGGGRASVSHPRTRLGPDAFRDCVVRVFEGVQFERPRGGRTTVSYSLRFEPAQGDGGVVR